MKSSQASLPLVVLLSCLAAPGAMAQTKPAKPPAQATDASAELKTLKRLLVAMQKQVNAMRAQLDAEAAERKRMQARIETLARTVEAADATVQAMRANSVLDLNGYVTFDNSSGYPTVLFNGINLQVVNGTGVTQSVNGLGNIIVGYNRPRNAAPVCSIGYYTNQAECTARGGVWANSHKSGSHNLVGGDFNSYASWGGVVFGLENAASAPYATVTGGAGNQALGDLSSIGGGSLNTAAGIYTSVNGGLGNAANGAFSTIGGGNSRTAAGSHDWSAGELTQDR